jgi:hypothetical protein
MFGNESAAGNKNFYLIRRQHSARTFYYAVYRKGGRCYHPHLRDNPKVRYLFDRGIDAEFGYGFTGMLLEKRAFCATGPQNLQFHHNPPT